jgi:hypothetical protein
MVMSPEQIKDIFDPVVKEVCDLVQGQVDSLRAKGGVVSGIILVGGFGQSQYLYRKLKAHFTSPAPPPYSERPTHAGAAAIEEEFASCEVMQPVYAWTAVVRGAVLRGLEGNMVISRKARMHYGTSYATVYDEDKHSVAERYWSPLWERWMVSDRMQWHIAKVASPSSPLPPFPHNRVCVLTWTVPKGRSHLPPHPHRLPLHAQLPPRPVPRRHRRPHRLRGRRAPRRLCARPRARVHAHDGPRRRPAQPVYAPDDDARRRV